MRCESVEVWKKRCTGSTGAVNWFEVELLSRRWAWLDLADVNFERDGQQRLEAPPR